MSEDELSIEDQQPDIDEPTKQNIDLCHIKQHEEAIKKHDHQN
jgi:hypothetical protein